MHRLDPFRLTTVLPAAALFFLAAQPRVLHASTIVYTASGTGTSGQAISGSATFTFVTHDFGSGAVNAVELTLRNTAAQTLVRGNLITGVFFSVSGPVGNLPTSASGFDGVAARVVQSNGSIINNVDLGPALANTATDGRYQLSNGPFGNANNGYPFGAFRYGISTVGGGLAGFSGSAVNGDDYGIFATGSSVSSGGLASARPLIEGSATFWIKLPAGWTSVNQLTNVRITYGSLPDNFLDATPSTPVPEPTGFALLGTGLVAAGSLRHRRRRSR